MMRVAVVAHAESELGGGLEELREVLSRARVGNPLWYQETDIRRIAGAARGALAAGAELIFVWGGDGTLQRAINMLAGRDATIAILPAGTGNVLAGNLGIPADIGQAVDIGLHGARMPLDTGTINGEHFAVMAGAGLDAFVMRDADSGLKERFGPVAYVLAGVKHLTPPAVAATVIVDGRPFLRDEISLVLAANVGQTVGGIEVFRHARPDDGLLELGVVTATNAIDWLRTLGRVAFGSPEESPFTDMTRGKRFEVHFDRPILYEVDGNPEKPVRRLRFQAHAASVAVCVPGPATAVART